MNHTDLLLREVAYLAYLGLQFGARVQYPMGVARPDKHKASAILRIGDIPLNVVIHDYKGKFVAQYFFESMFFTDQNKRMLEVLVEKLRSEGRPAGQDLEPLAPHTLDAYMQTIVEMRR